MFGKLSLYTWRCCGSAPSWISCAKNYKGCTTPRSIKLKGTIYKILKGLAGGMRILAVRFQCDNANQSTLTTFPTLDWIGIYLVGGSPGLVVRGWDSFYEGHWFGSQHHMLDGHFSHWFAIKIVHVCLIKI